MLEKDFAQLYRTSQERTHAPAGLVAASLTAARESYAAKDAPQRPASRVRPRPRWAMGIAACLALVLVLFGGAAIIAGLPAGQPQARAYAKTPNLLTTELGDGIVPFALDDHTAMQGWGRGEDALGSFTGMQFTLEGEGIARVQATLSRGELYQVTTETFDRTTDEGVVILEEALSWKPFSKGTGDYLAEYDWVTPYSIEDGLDRNDPNHKMQPRLIKRIGSTIDMPYEGEPLTFGLWFDDVEFLENDSPDIQSLDGTELTVTAEYDNGAFRTQAMTLHDGWFSIMPSNPNQGADTVVAEGPFAEKPMNSPDRAPSSSSTQTLYGEVTSVVNEPHPYSLENANVRADEAPVPEGIENDLPSYGSTLSVDGLPQEDCLFGPSDSIPGKARATGSDDWVELQWSGFTARIVDALDSGEYVQPYEGRDVVAFRGNYEYLRRVREKTNGWSIDENGVPSDGNALVVVDAEVTNPHDESVRVDTGSVGALCAVGRDAGSTTFATPGVFAAKDHKARLWAPGRALWMDPGDTVHLEAVFVVDKALLESGELHFALGEFEELNRGALTEDLDDISYVSLGKLEGR